MTIGFNLRGNINYLLVALVIIHFSYPLSELGNSASAIYVTLYCIMLGIGVYVTGIDRRRIVIGTAMTVLTVIAGIVWALTSNDRVLNRALFVFYVIIISDLIFIGYTIWEFIFVAERVTRNIIAAGITLYLLIGNIFTPLYFLLNATIKAFTGADAFDIHTHDGVIGWQRMYYFSFTTLTTLGYGDVTPLSPFVEPFVTAEAIIGVLYVAVLMARLVSLYESQQGRDK